MKRTKKLLALVLAMMMAFSMLAMPAAAYDEDEGVMPLYEVTDCPDCGKNARVTRSYEYNVLYPQSSECPNSFFAHLHLWEYAYVVRTICMSCSYDNSHYTCYGESCPLSK